MRGTRAEASLARDTGNPPLSPGFLGLLLFGLYTMLLVLIARHMPFWLDEVLQLIGTSQVTLGALLHFIPSNPGASPLGYLLQYPLVHWLGPTWIAARFLPALCSLFSCWVIWRFASDLGVPGGAAVLAGFMILPIQLRYATEARPYSEALLFSLTATWWAWKLGERPRWPTAAWYSLLVAAGLYFQPFSALIQAGSCVWAVTRGRRALVMAASALFGAAMIFLPWYLYSKSVWQQAITASGFAFAVSPKFVLLPIKEISGGGYVCSLSLLIASYFGVRAITRSKSLLLCWNLAAGTVLALVADSAFHYFFAIRQLLFVVPALLILGVAGVLAMPNRKLAISLTALFVISAAVQDIRFPLRRNENWAAAARALEQAADSGTCIAAAPADHLQLYTVFVPGLDQHVCLNASLPGSAVLTSDPYTKPAELQDYTRRLEALGYVERRRATVGGAVLDFYQKSE